MAIATTKIKEMLDSGRDEALGLYKAFVDELAGMKNIDGNVDIQALKAKVDPLMTSLETLKSVLAMDNGPDIKAELPQPMAPFITGPKPKMPAYEPAQSSIRKLSAEGVETSHILTSGPVHDAT